MQQLLLLLLIFNTVSHVRTLVLAIGTDSEA